MIVMLPFSILRGAVFTEPSVTKIEKVIGQIHGTAADYQAPVRPAPDSYVVLSSKNPPRVGALG